MIVTILQSWDNAMKLRCAKLYTKISIKADRCFLKQDVFVRRHGPPAGVIPWSHGQGQDQKVSTNVIKKAWSKTYMHAKYEFCVLYRWKLQARLKLTDRCSDKQEVRQAKSVMSLTSQLFNVKKVYKVMENKRKQKNFCQLHVP